MASTQVNLEHYDYLLQTVQLQVQGDLFFMCWLDDQNDLLNLSVHPSTADTPPTALIRRLCHASASQGQTHIFYGGMPDAAPYVGGAVACTPTSDGTLVTGVLTIGSHHYADAEAVANAGAIAARLLEVENLRAEKAIRDRLHNICKALLQLNDVQAMIEVIQTGLPDDKMSACALLLYGPNNTAEDSIEYVEVAGTWGRTFGSGYGLGTRVYLNNETHMALLDVLDREGVLLPDDQTMHYVEQDALLRGLLKARMVADWALYALHTPYERAGLLLLATDDPAGFTDAEQQQHQELAKIIAMAVSLQMLRQELRANKYGRAALLDAVNDGVLIATPGTNGATVTMINERFREMFDCQDLPRAVKLSQVLEQMQVPPSVRSRLGAAWKSIPLRDQRTLHGSFEMITHHGQPVDISWYSAPMYNPEGDDVFARVYIFHDTTPEQAAAQVRSAFLSRVSHELRTPLTAISGFSEFILEASGDDLPDLAREYTEIIHESARHLKEVFTDLIDITRAYAGEVELNLYTVDLAVIARSVVQQLRDNAQAREQTVTVEVEGDPHAHADPDRIGQILRQLLENAVVYSPQQAEIRVVISTLHEATALPPHAPSDVMLPGVLVEVIDTGPGISAADAAAVFEPFHRGRHALARQIPGTGLGLTLAHSLIDLHRGKIWVEPATAHRKGGQVCFVLPAAR